MANTIIVTQDCTLRVPFLPPREFEVGEEVSPGSRYYLPLLWSGLANDTGIPDPGVMPEALPEAMFAKGGSSFDGSIPVYNSTTGLWDPVNQDDRVVAYASNRTGTATVASVSPAAPTVIPGVVIDVPPSDGRVIKLKWGALWGITTAGAGRVQLPLYEITGGSSVLVAAPYQLTQAATPAAGAFGGWQEGPWIDIGVVTTWRKFGMCAQVVRDGGSSLAAYTHNLDAHGAFPFLTAEVK